MDVGNGTGKHMTRVKLNNKARVKAWFEQNPGKTIKACCRDLFLTRQTVYKHIKEISAEEQTEKE